MSTPHNEAEKGQFAKTVLMPGDPLRAKFIAETFLENAVQVNGVRGMLGFTGTYKGKEISVMGGGMGMPSIGIYSYELFTQYDVDKIIRIGSAGGYSKELNEDDITYPSKELTDELRKAAKELNIPIREGYTHSSDVFYRQPSDESPTYWEKLRDERGCLCVEMESFALFHNANVTGKQAACLLTISDSLVTHEETTADERQNAFTAMMKIALELAE